MEIPLEIIDIAEPSHPEEQPHRAAQHPGSKNRQAGERNRLPRPLLQYWVVNFFGAFSSYDKINIPFRKMPVYFATKKNKASVDVPKYKGFRF